MFHHLNHGGAHLLSQSLELTENGRADCIGEIAGADRRTRVVGRHVVSARSTLEKSYESTFPSYDGFIMPQMEENGNYEKMQQTIKPERHKAAAGRENLGQITRICRKMAHCVEKTLIEEILCKKSAGSITKYSGLTSYRRFVIITM